MHKRTLLDPFVYSKILSASHFLGTTGTGTSPARGGSDGDGEESPAATSDKRIMLRNATRSYCSDRRGAEEWGTAEDITTLVVTEEEYTSMIAVVLPDNHESAAGGHFIFIFQL